MLARAARLRNADDFRQTLREGRRCGTRTISIHALFDDSAAPPRVGFVVAKTVGVAVRRNRVKRRLRAVVRAELTRLPGGRIVIRALPAAGGADFSTLAADVCGCLNRLRCQPT